MDVAAGDGCRCASALRLVLGLILNPNRGAGSAGMVVAANGGRRCTSALSALGVMGCRSLHLGCGR